MLKGKKLKSIIGNSFHHFRRGAVNYAKKVLPESVKKIIKSVIRLVESRTINRHRKLLKELLGGLTPGKDYKTIVIFPPSLDWNVQLFQRPQQLAIALARQGALVFYIQPKLKRSLETFQQIQDRLFLCNAHVDAFHYLDEPFIYLLTWNNGYAERFTNPRIIYDFVDDIEVFHGNTEEIRKGHQVLLQRAFLVLATARQLFEEVKKVRTDVIYSPNGVVYEHFAGRTSFEWQAIPNDLQPVLSKNKPVIGYYGALARWFDYALLKKCAELRPEYQFVLIGPDYDGTLDPAGVFSHENIHWLGVKQYVELPIYLHYFDVATIPFIVNDITHAVSPLKLFEYMAAGKPIVITPMRESLQYEGLLVAQTPEEFADKLDQAIKLKNNSPYQDLVKRQALQNTWDSRAEEIIQRIENN